MIWQQGHPPDGMFLIELSSLFDDVPAVVDTFDQRHPHLYLWVCPWVLGQHHQVFDNKLVAPAGVFLVDVVVDLLIVAVAELRRRVAELEDENAFLTRMVDYLMGKGV